jgi:ketosteroid isomerase-like protein
MRLLFASLFLVAACASAPAEPPVTAAPVIAAERAFSARAGEIGWIAAFREYTAPDGQLGQADIVSAPETLAAADGPGGRLLYWQPAYAGIARSGDLGFTTGPFSVDETRTPRGQYFTVWRRQPDGSWKWIWDGGPGPMAELGPIPEPTSDVASLPVAAAGVGSAEEAARQVVALERGAANAAALARYLAEDAHVYRPGRARAYGGEAADAAFATPAGAVAHELARAEASAAGDLVFTLGETAYAVEGQARRGYFARIWQYRPEGWRIVFDAMIARAPAGN